MSPFAKVLLLRDYKDSTRYEYMYTLWNNDYPLPSVGAYFGSRNVGMQSACPIAELYLHVTRVCGSVIELHETAPYA